MKKKHRDNLAKLADYLAALPADYEHFDMDDYNRDRREGSRRHLYIQDRRYGCGTVACAVGHGPAAGIRVYGDAVWASYCRRVFGIGRNDGRGGVNETFEYLFGSAWTQYDNTPQGAAERIRTFLDSGVPADWKEKRSEVL